MGMRSLLALPMATNGTLGTLNLYARYPQAFGVIDRARGLLLASMAGFACSTRVSRGRGAPCREPSCSLGHARADRPGPGILIERERISADQAFHILRQASQHLNVKLREVAQGPRRYRRATRYRVTLDSAIPESAVQENGRTAAHLRYRKPDRMMSDRISPS